MNDHDETPSREPSAGHVDRPEAAAPPSTADDTITPAPVGEPVAAEGDRSPPAGIPDPAEDDDGLFGLAGSPTDPRRGWRRVRKVALVLTSISLVLGLIGAGGLWWVMNRYVADIDRVENVFEGLENRPAELPDDESGDPMTILLVGSDVRSDDATTGVYAGEDGEASRSDTIMVMRLAGDKKSAEAVSIPRDSWVDIPGHGMHKINAAYAFGGASLLVQTVESVTGVRIDHFALVDFAGFKSMTDALGGVDVDVAEQTSWYGITFEKGLNHLNGEEALGYVRQREGLPRGDFDRVQRQQNYLRAMFGTVQDRGLLTSPGKLDDFLIAFGKSVSVDDTFGDFDLVKLAFKLRKLKSSSVKFLTAPTLGTGMEGAQSVVYLDPVRGALMWQAMRDGTLAGAVDFEALPATPR